MITSIVTRHTRLTERAVWEAALGHGAAEDTRGAGGRAGVRLGAVPVGDGRARARGADHDLAERGRLPALRARGRRGDGRDDRGRGGADGGLPERQLGPADVLGRRGLARGRCRTRASSSAATGCGTRRCVSCDTSRAGRRATPRSRTRPSGWRRRRA